MRGRSSKNPPTPWAGGSCAVFLRGVDGGDPDFFQLRAFAERLCIFPEKKNTDRPEGQSVFLVGEDGFPPSEDKLRLHLPRKEKYQSPKKGNWYFWWSRAELKRTLSLVILYCVNCGFYWDLDCIFIAGEAEHQPQIIVISIHRDQECVK